MVLHMQIYKNTVGFINGVYFTQSTKSYNITSATVRSADGILQKPHR
jgi:hypothetical protein